MANTFGSFFGLLTALRRKFTKHILARGRLFHDLFNNPEASVSYSYGVVVWGDLMGR